MKLFITILVIALFTTASVLFFIGNTTNENTENEVPPTSNYSSDEFGFSFEYSRSFGDINESTLDNTGDECIIAEPEGPRRQCDGKILSIGFSDTPITVTAATANWLESKGPIPEAYFLRRGFDIQGSDVVFNAVEGYTTDGVVPNARFDEDLQAVIAEGVSSEALGNDTNTYYAKNTSTGGVVITVPEDGSIEQAEQLVRSLSVN